MQDHLFFALFRKLEITCVLLCVCYFVDQVYLSFPPLRSKAPWSMHYDISGFHKALWSQLVQWCDVKLDWVHLMFSCLPKLYGAHLLLLHIGTHHVACHSWTDNLFILDFLFNALSAALRDLLILIICHRGLSLEIFPSVAAYLWIQYSQVMCCCTPPPSLVSLCRIYYGPILPIEHSQLLLCCLYHQFLDVSEMNYISWQLCPSDALWAVRIWATPHITCTKQQAVRTSGTNTRHVSLGLTTYTALHSRYLRIVSVCNLLKVWLAMSSLFVNVNQLTLQINCATYLLTMKYSDK